MRARTASRVTWDGSDDFEICFKAHAFTTSGSFASVVFVIVMVSITMVMVISVVGVAEKKYENDVTESCGCLLTSDKLQSA